MTKKQIKEFPPKIKKETLTKPPWNQQTSKGEPGIVSPPQLTVLFWHAPGSWKPRNVEPLAIIPWCQLTQQRTWLAAGCLGCLQSIWKVASANYTMKLQPADQITADGIPTHAVTRKHPTTGLQPHLQISLTCLHLPNFLWTSYSGPLSFLKWQNHGFAQQHARFRLKPLVHPSFLTCRVRLVASVNVTKIRGI